MDGGDMRQIYTDTDKTIYLVTPATDDTPQVEHVVWHRLPQPAVAATLNAVLGLWSLAEAAAVAGVPAEALVAEAESWAAFG